jgi:hypothetical protein
MAWKGACGRGDSTRPQGSGIGRDGNRGLPHVRLHKGSPTKRYSALFMSACKVMRNAAAHRRFASPQLDSGLSVLEGLEGSAPEEESSTIVL